jgi:uncharacterized protein YaaN involved in tellurite resistance
MESNTAATTDMLVLHTPDTIAMDLQKERKTATVDAKLVAQATIIVDGIFAVDPRELREQQRQSSAISQLGSVVQKELGSRSAMLKKPMASLVRDAEDGGTVASSMLSLQKTTNEINPNRVDFSMGTVMRILSKIPGVGTPVANWVAKYQSVESAIEDIVKNLEGGQKELERDNIILIEDQISMRELTFKLDDFVEMGKLMDTQVAVRLNELDPTDERCKFIQEEILFPLRQRIIDLQQQQAVNQQGVLTTELIIRNNKELIRGVSRALNVTINALSIAATLALALETQRKVLESVQAVNRTTEDMLVETASKLKTQGAEIHKEASSAQLDIDKLNIAFTSVQEAIEDVSAYRRNALPGMMESIVLMDKLTNDMEKSIVKLEGGTKAQDGLVIDIL